MISVTGNKVPVKIDTICVHGDTPTAVEMARQLRAAAAEGGRRAEGLHGRIARTRRNVTVVPL